MQSGVEGGKAMEPNCERLGLSPTLTVCLLVKPLCLPIKGVHNVKWRQVLSNRMSGYPAPVNVTAKVKSIEMKTNKQTNRKTVKSPFMQTNQGCVFLKKSVLVFKISVHNIHKSSSEDFYSDI